jgi:hypothetical protein
MAELARCRAISPALPPDAPLAEDFVRKIRDA